MKLVKIFGMVLALHVVLLTVFFLSPGCQSTPQTPANSGTNPPEDAAGAAVQPVAENWSSQPAADDSFSAGSRGSTLTPTPAGGAPLTSLTPAERARTSPMRPMNPDEFIGTSDLPPALSETASASSGARGSYTVAAGDSLWKISRKFGTTVQAILQENPGVKGDSLQPGDVLNLPAGTGTPATANATRAPNAAASGASATSSAAASTYTVRSGDSLSKIAARNGTTVAALRQANNLHSDVIQVGQVINIPGGSGAPASVSGSSPASSTPPTATGTVTVTVQAGDTLGAIASRFDVTVKALMAANKITDPRRIQRGQTLVIPGYQPVASAPGASAPAPAPTRASSAAPRTTTPATQPTTTTPAEQPAPDLESMIPPDSVDAPVVPVDEPTPQP